jgi:hypothetical protein
MFIKNILVFPGGTEIGLEINKSLRHIKDIQLYSAGSDVSNPAPYFYKRHFILPTIYEKDWIKKLNELIHENNINFIFPAYDDIIVALAKNKAKINTEIISSPLETCILTRSKSETYKCFENIIPVPKIYRNNEIIETYPVFLKPDKGQGSKDTYLVKSDKEYNLLMEKKKKLIAIEYLPGKEFTIDCFSDREEGILFCQGRLRNRIRNGISVNSRIVENKKFREYAEKISSHLDLYGAWFFQLKESKDFELKLMEIAPRIAGTMALNRVRGINFPLLSLYEHQRIKLEIMINNFDIIIDRALQNRYDINISYKTVYVDLDDTLILKNQVNAELIKYLYQCVNKKKRIILLTRHKEKIQNTLKKYKISDLLFDEIRYVGKNDLKSDYIKDRNSIFIDDSFSERKDVASKRNIYTFDCSMIDCLLEDKF